MPGMQGLGTSSAVINGQIVPQARSFLMYPVTTGPVIQGVPASPVQTAGATGGAGMSDNASAAGANPWSPVQSPVPWMIGMFIVGYLMLRHVHWGY